MFMCGRMQGPLDGSGYGYCALTVDGQSPIDTGNVAGGLLGVRIAQRRTIEGNPCRLPVVYQCVALPSHTFSFPCEPLRTLQCT
jgi:hypothetical protein